MRAWMAALILLGLALPLLAITPAADTSYEAWTQVQRAQLGGAPGYIRLKTYYTYNIQANSGRSGGAGDALSGDIDQTQLKPLSGAALRLTLNGAVLTDASGQPVCQGLITSDGSGSSGLQDGEAECSVPGGFYAPDPDPSKAGRPRALANWPRCDQVQLELVGSQNEGRIKILHPAMLPFCPSNPQGSSLFYLLNLDHPSAGLMSACLPIVLVLGLLMASMYYRGKDPLMLFDITTPRLPAMRKLRMKGVTQPHHLASKGRMADRIIGRAEATMASTLYALYKKGGKGDPRGELDKILPKGKVGFISERITKGAQAFGNEEKLREAMKKLDGLVDRSGASDAEKDRARRILLEMVQTREAHLMEKKVHTYARLGDRSISAKLNPTVDFLTTRLAKPWRLVPKWANKAWANNLPGIPYVERTGLVITGWVANRGGNVSMRQQLRRTTTAEIGVKLGLLDREKSEYAKRHLYDNRKIGNIPLIMEKLRNESFVLGKAIMDEHLRAMILAATLKREQGKDGGVTVSINQAKLAEILKLVDQARKESGGDPLTMRERLNTLLQQYASGNASSMVFLDAAGNVLSAAERDRFLKQADEHIRTVVDVLRADGQYLKGSLLAEFNAQAAKMKPDDVFGRYNQLVDLLSVYAKEARDGEGLRNGRVPMVYIGPDLAELIGRSVSARQLGGQLRLDEVQRMVVIRQHMEEESMRRMLFDRIIGIEKIAGRDGREIAALIGGRLNPEWMRGVDDALGLARLRSDLEYNRRGEWAARNFLTGYNANDRSVTLDGERNKIEILRQRMAFALGGTQENLLRNYWTQIERNQLIYHTMKELSKFYTGREWSAESYEQWKKDGVRFKDVQKGVWLIGGERALTPVASNILRTADGKIVGVRVEWDANGRLRHNTPSRIESHLDAQGRTVYAHGALSFAISDYADRPVNLSYLYKMPDGKWRPGSPTDRETNTLFAQQKAAWLALSEPAYGSTRGDWRGTVDPALREALASGRALSREQIWGNIRRIEEMLGERVRAVPRSSLMDDPTQTAWTRTMARTTQALERTMRGGIHDSDERLHAWYAAQAYARVVMLNLNRDVGSGEMYSQEVRDSLNAKKDLTAMREEQMGLLAKPSLSAAEQARLQELRGQIEAKVRDIPLLEERARQYQKANADVDRNLKKTADLAVPYYNVAEQVNMRDPRVAFGGGYAMGAALMVGYQTGQFVGERAQMWAGYNLYPGDRVVNLFARPNYYASLLFGMSTRTFFTKMTGYTTLYHMDPERGPLATNSHEPGIAAGFQSLFKPSQSFDWFTRFYANPIMRGFKANDYKNEFGWAVKEEGNWGGIRYNLPFTFKYGAHNPRRSGGTDDVSDIDRRNYSMMGMDAGEEMRRRKLGLTFREEYFLWDKRDRARDQVEGEQNLRTLRDRLNTLTDPAERRMLGSQIKELEMTFNATKAAWSIPGVRSFTRQGYYAVENRSGYDISAIGAAHRPWELYAPYHKNVGPTFVPIPGMLGYDYNNNWTIFPRVARSLATPTDTFPSNWYDRKQLRAGGKDSNQSTTSPLASFNYLATRSEGMQGIAGVENDLFRESLRDVYRRETPVMGKFFDLEMQRQSWSFQNSEYTIPLAPLYLGLYHAFRHNSAWARSQTWNQIPPTEKDRGEMTDTERRQEIAMRTAREAAMREGQSSYTCPTHGIRLSGGQACPLCRNSEQLKMENEQSWLSRTALKKREQLKSLAIASFSFSEHVGEGYQHYQNQAHCAVHGIGYTRGTACPLCLNDTVRRSGGEAAERVNRYRQTIENYSQSMRQVETDKSLSEEERGRRLYRMRNEREEQLQSLGVQIDRDTRLGFNQGRMYLQAEMEELKKLEAKRNYRIKWD